VNRKYNLIAQTTIIISFFLFAVFLFARENGKTGKTQLSASPGCTCHGAATAGVSVVIDGPTTLSIGKKATYTITVKDGPLAAAGTNVAVSSGNLNILDGSLRKENGELTHTSPKSPANNKVIFEFEYTAPSTEGDVTMAANGNSVNLSGTNSGDQWNFADNKIITVQNTTAITDTQPATPNGFELKQNFPNPFNPVTKINYSLDKSGNVQLTVYDALGKIIATLVDGFQTSGSYVVDFNGGSLESGIYMYRLNLGNKTISKRMLLIK
jgi:type IX secretion system substrate protein